MKGTKDVSRQVLESYTVQDTTLNSQLPSARSPTRTRRILLLLSCGIALFFAFLAGFVLRPLEQYVWLSRLAPNLPRITQTFQDHKIYSKGPSDDSTAAWNKMIPLGKGWVRLPEYPGAPASASGKDIYNIAVYHQLHCLNELRLAYYSLLTPTYSSNSSDHVMHCIEYLRQSLACAGDTTLEPFNQEYGGTLTWGVQHQCRDLRVLGAWAREKRPWDLEGITN